MKKQNLDLKITTIILLSLVGIITFMFFVPQKKVWKYEIHGKVETEMGPHDAIWYTDTLERGMNYISYHNSDGTQVVIAPPYVIIDRKYNLVIEDTNQFLR